MKNIQEEPRRNWRVMKFLNEPRNFSGETTKSGNKGLEDVSTAAKVWLNRLERLRITAKLEDDDILLIAGDHLIGKAEKWWYVVGSKVKTWNEFVDVFKKDYVPNLNDQWWYELSHIKQGFTESVVDFALRMKELLSLVDNNVPEFQVRLFLMGIHPHIACEIEKTNTPKDLNEAIQAATKIERTLSKYEGRMEAIAGVHSSRLSAAGSLTGTRSTKNDASDGIDLGDDHSIASTLAGLVKGMEQLRINLVQLQEQQRPANRTTGYNGSPTACYYCKEEGHRKIDCPKFKERMNSNLMATGSNAVPLGNGSGKEQERL